MGAKIKKGDLVEVIAGRTSDEKKLAKRNERRAEKACPPSNRGIRASRVGY